MRFRNAIFIISEERKCPLYNAREELHIHEGVLTLPPAKSTCLILAQDLIGIISREREEALEKFQQGTIKKTSFECGGCSELGRIRFEYKKEKGFATKQMKLLEDAKRREKLRPISDLVKILADIEIFNSLSHNDLLDLAALLEFRGYEQDATVLKKGELGTHLHILLAGHVKIVNEEGVSVAEVGPGGVLGEVSLLSGDLITSTVITKEPCHIALLSQKDFKHLLKRYPSLQVLFYKLQAKRITEINRKRAEELSSGMVGDLSNVPPVEICQMLNSNVKSGHLRLDLTDRRGVVIFNKGEVIHARLGPETGREAFYKIIALENGRFKFIQGLTEYEKDQEIIGGFMGLLMEGMKKLDDKRSNKR